MLLPAISSTKLPGLTKCSFSPLTVPEPVFPAVTRQPLALITVAKSKAVTNLLRSAPVGRLILPAVFPLVTVVKVVFNTLYEILPLLSKVTDVPVPYSLYPLNLLQHYHLRLRS